MIENFIAFALSNYSLSFLFLTTLAAAISMARAPRPWRRAQVVEAFFSYFLLFNVGFYIAYNFVMHVFFGEMAVSFIGWANSPFQAEVGFASLGFAVVGFLAFRGDFSMRLAAVVGPACFLLGAAGGHVYQMITAGNFEPGNAGIVFYTDLLIPMLGFTLLWLQAHPGETFGHDHEREGEASAEQTRCA